jgi:hypothetical protein
MSYLGKNIWYSWESILGFSILLGIIVWSYTKHIAFLLYSNIGLLITCIILLNLFAARTKYKKQNGGWNALSFLLILYPFVFISITMAIGYVMYPKN